MVNVVPHVRDGLGSAALVAAAICLVPYSGTARGAELAKEGERSAIHLSYANLHRLRLDLRNKRPRGLSPALEHLWQWLDTEITKRDVAMNVVYTRLDRTDRKGYHIKGLSAMPDLEPWNVPQEHFDAIWKYVMGLVGLRAAVARSVELATRRAAGDRSVSEADVGDSYLQAYNDPFATDEDKEVLETSLVACYRTIRQEGQPSERLAALYREARPVLRAEALVARAVTAPASIAVAGGGVVTRMAADSLRWVGDRARGLVMLRRKVLRAEFP